MRRLLPCLALAAALLALGAATETATTPVDLNSADVREIATLPGVSEKLAAAIVKRRTEGAAFKDFDEVRAVPGMTDRIWAGIEERVRLLPPVTAQVGQDVVPAPTLTAVANYFVEFEGIDLSALPDKVRGEFLETVNHEICTCGCNGDTMARCYVNDPGCAVARKRLQSLYAKLLAESTAKPASH